MGLLLLLAAILVCCFFWLRGYVSEYLHHLAVFVLRILPSSWVPNYAPKTAESTACMGLTFRNRVGMAAGFDKQAQCLRALQKMGFGFVEIGGVTPKPQPGNPKPRVFRLTKHQAVINRYGLNSHGVDKIAQRLAQFKRKGMVVGANLAPNTNTAPEQWLGDYAVSLQKLYPLVDYFTINVSCPNTGHAASQQSFELLDALLQGIHAEAESCAVKQGIAKRPLLVKIAADLDDAAVRKLKELAISHHFDGIVAVNTSTSRKAVEGHHWAEQTGGLSGRPLYQQMRQIVGGLAEPKPCPLTLVAVGGIENKQQVNELLETGASLIQIYTRFVYRGPKCLKDLL